MGTSLFAEGFPGRDEKSSLRTPCPQRECCLGKGGRQPQWTGYQEGPGTAESPVLPWKSPQGSILTLTSHPPPLPHCHVISSRDVKNQISHPDQSLRN